MQKKIIDLTHILNEKVPVYPDTEGPVFGMLNTVKKDGFAEMKVTMVFHLGTHIDAPCHIIENTKSLDQFPVDKFIGKAIVIPCQEIDEITLEYLRTFQNVFAEVDFILFFTGWQYKWNTKSYFDDCPVLTDEAAKWLTKFDLKGIGIDAFSIDKVISASKFTTEKLLNHNTLLGKDIILIENLTNLDKLPNNIFSFQCLPINVENADGSPVRAIATINE